MTMVVGRLREENKEKAEEKEKSCYQFVSVENCASK